MTPPQPTVFVIDDDAFVREASPDPGTIPSFTPL
jgi:hypothetical protein